MPRAKRRTPRRQRVGKVSVYPHHGSWHIYYRAQGQPVRRRIGTDPCEALRVAAEVNTQLAAELAPAMSFAPLTVATLRARFLDHHELVLNSSLTTVSRYRSATKHLEDFAGEMPAHRLDPDRFIRHLRTLEVAPNGHPNSTKRRLREKGIRFVLETCRSMYAFAAKKRHLPPYHEITFSPPGLRRRGLQDAKPIYVFDCRSELAFFDVVGAWALPIFLTLAKTGLRPGELIHTLVEDLDLDGGWWHVRNKPALNWWVKTRRDRSVPLVPELVEVLRHTLNGRDSGPVFLRQHFKGNPPSWSSANQNTLARVVEQQIAAQVRARNQVLRRSERAGVARGVWRDAGAVRPEALRKAFLATTRAVGLAHVTCPKCWRHTFATLLQEANVDPQIRQLTLGHSANRPEGSPLGMTGMYTHTSPQLMQQEIFRAVRLRPQTLALAIARRGGSKS
jgi:integrase